MQKEEIREAITLENQQEKIFGVLHRPLSSTHPVPAVVVCPGFGGNKCGKFRLFVTLGKELAKRGIAVLRFDYRGAGDSEGEFQDMTLEGKISDALTCLDFLAQDPQIDATRLGLLGRSLGGAIAVLAARRYPSIKSLALWAPIFKSDPWRKLWEAYQADPQGLSKQEIFRLIPTAMPNLEFVNQFFQLDLARELKELQQVPLLHIHGEQDRIVEIEHAQDYKRIREGLGLTRFVRLPHSDHDFSDFNEQTTAIQETCDWYQKTL